MPDPGSFFALETAVLGNGRPAWIHLGSVPALWLDVYNYVWTLDSDSVPFLRIDAVIVPTANSSSICYYKVNYSGPLLPGRPTEKNNVPPWTRCGSGDATCSLPGRRRMYPYFSRQMQWSEFRWSDWLSWCVSPLVFSLVPHSKTEPSTDVPRHRHHQRPTGLFLCATLIHLSHFVINSDSTYVKTREAGSASTVTYQHAVHFAHVSHGP
ncbi:hypothetical protein DFH08DRAFT_506179 [Mycena albidolilacea]|uniref:Uncharacterized protein n=1 Tax=Mycena albidolilacea TaxID=1033008 RepID=A0AAD7ADE8_9AGAR|nr:hypothetical protein DFH08DRAFT_506179 [Mycena albidolilacea]